MIIKGKYKLLISAIFALIFSSYLLPNLRPAFHKLSTSYGFIRNRLVKKEFKMNICLNLTNKITKIIDLNYLTTSITILDPDDSIIVDINGNELRIPASNQKIFTTAFSLAKLGPRHSLTTTLYKNRDGFYELIGSGDPDLNLNDITTITSKISENPFFSHTRPYLVIYEEPEKSWWPESWSLTDRQEDYGAPISRLAISSNATDYAINDPLTKFVSSTNSLLVDNNIFIDIITKDYIKFNNNNNNNRKILYTKNSAPLYMLLNLANSESHNFTSEVLLRNTSNSWYPSISSDRLYNWLINIGVDKDHVNIFDGSGLSRRNRATTRSITYVLSYMQKHKYSNYFISSMSLLGYRGTLKDYYKTSLINSKFLGKSGTLNGVRSLSGYLYTPNGIRIVSIIQNDQNYNESLFSDILSEVYKEQNCL
ncbi:MULTISPECIES: D-alanyl-D-alanine carboxypeptidase [unclassified Prochlorococcus]|uniref:D-alanyl-D-alanine carboxypeptidase n=1 Tax=unclassified Prochlorococcus TaxID=2627481 RepID=UPI00053398D6|nr:MULTISPECIES: D-alanyl-D-alanine carboxypeptidase [unclassified Prochlorococcus]KGG15274.1 D-alanyl-D-alanine carboxypeptidase [Prochlorococcus sp. MIT 0602]KGG17551.1 D-alanyl-D-alanine carboxypeptidase [Prochlorococcus sp. MIT 0603]